jgi:hypothetical protein
MSGSDKGSNAATRLFHEVILRASLSRLRFSFGRLVHPHGSTVRGAGADVLEHSSRMDVLVEVTFALLAPIRSQIRCGRFVAGINGK